MRVVLALVCLVGCADVSGLNDYDLVGDGAGAGSAGSGGEGAGGSGGERPSVLPVDEGVLVRYFMDDLPAGEASGMLGDATGRVDAPDLELFAGANFNLTIFEQATGTGMAWLQFEDEGHARAEIGTSSLTSIDMTGPFTVEMVLGPIFTDDSAAPSIVLFVGSPTLPALQVAISANDNVQLLINSSVVRSWPYDRERRFVSHIIYDPTDDDPVVAYHDGVRQTAAANPPVGSFSVGSDAELYVGNNAIGGRSPQGDVGYVAIYDAPMSLTGLRLNRDALLVSDDTP